jgi:type VI protein secretion system component Hcp
MAVMIYFDGLSGNASDKRYKHWTATRYVQFNRPRIAKSTTEFVMTADLDATTNVLFQRANSGVPFRYVRVHWLDQNNAAGLKVHFDKVFVTTVQVNSHYEGTPVISVELSADRWEHEK